MLLYLDKMEDQPLYLQVKNHLNNLITSQILKPGTKLPSSREFAMKLGVHRNTVVHAYEELEVEGKIVSQIGRGTFVNEVKTFRPTHSNRSEIDYEELNFDFQLSRHWDRMNETVLSKILDAHSRNSGVISFAIPFLPEKDFPRLSFQNSAYLAIQRHGFGLFNLNQSAGFQPFLEFLPKLLIKRGITSSQENCMTVNGIQQGLDLISKIFLEPDDAILVEETTFSGALEIFKSYGAKIIPVPMDERGMRIDKLPPLIRKFKPKFIYTIPTFQNPTTVTMPLERRKKLLEVAQRYVVPLVEDDYLSEMRCDGSNVVSLKGLDKAGIVIYLSSVSKALLMGVRLGWIVASGDILRKLILAKQTSDIQSNFLIQAIVYDYCQKGLYDKHLKRNIRLCRRNRDIMLEAASRHLPHWVRISPPEGGYFLWAELPPEISGSEIAQQAVRQNVSFVPKKYFVPDRGSDNGFRLSCVGPTEREIEEGVRIIGRILREYRASRVA